MKRLPRFAWPFSRKTNTSDYRFRLSLLILGLRNVSFIKIDVEGSEMDVINGARRLLAKQRPALIVEIWNLQEPEIRTRKVNTICAYG